MNKIVQAMAEALDKASDTFLVTAGGAYALNDEHAPPAKVAAYFRAVIARALKEEEEYE